MYKKFDFLDDDYIMIDGNRLNRIVATAFIKRYDVAPGDKGGYVEKSSNVNQCDDAWVGGNACVYGDALVCGNALVTDNAKCYGKCTITDEAVVCGNAEVCGKALIQNNAMVCDSAIVRARAEIGNDASIGGICDINKDVVINVGKFEMLCTDELENISKMIGKTHMKLIKQIEEMSAYKKKKFDNTFECKETLKMYEKLKLILRDTSAMMFFEVKNPKECVVNGLEVRKLTKEEVEKRKLDRMRSDELIRQRKIKLLEKGINVDYKKQKAK